MSDANRKKAQITLHAADVAFTKRALPTSKSDGVKALYVGNSAPIEFVSSGSAQPAQRTSKTADMLNPLFCAACNKVFAKETVFHAHKGGKKHIQALKTMGLFEEADAAAAAAAGASTLKRNAVAAGANEPPAAKRPNPTPGAKLAADADTPPPSPPLAPTPAPLPPAEGEWWKGTVHAKPKDAEGGGGADENKGEWLCVSQRCAGIRNTRNAPHCKACGALRRLGTQGVRADMHDSVNDYARRK
ncbi:hypothetical protein T492DRAFT_969144 [Pavlovales sp. CCMP2436]|nr:hypothetical protein T492DRAFT_969144 [Pavlovales sp. CCMP2436]